MRKVPVKNYLIAIIIMVATIILTLLLADAYNDSVDIKNKNYLNTLSEIKMEEIDNYVIETHDIMIYMTDRETTDKAIDKKFEEIITKNDKKEYVVFLNLNRLENTFYTDFANKYNIDRELLKSNTLVIFKDGKVNKVINFTEKNVKKTDDYISNYFGE